MYLVASDYEISWDNKYSLFFKFYFKFVFFLMTKIVIKNFRF